MKKYVGSFYCKDDEYFSCLYEMDNYRELDEDFEFFFDYIAQFDIKKIVIGNDLMTFRKNEETDSYEWKSMIGNEFYPGLYSEDENTIIAEFEDDEDAIMWFKLNYGESV